MFAGFIVVCLLFYMSFGLWVDNCCVSGFCWLCFQLFWVWVGCAGLLIWLVALVG